MLPNDILSRYHFNAQSTISVTCILNNIFASFISIQILYRVYIRECYDVSVFNNIKDVNVERYKWFHLSQTKYLEHKKYCT